MVAMMASLESMTLAGCAPTPLASYLKALGLLRLVSSAANHVSGRAADADARGSWEHESFHLRTRLDRDALCRFLLDAYAPSPIIAPWNGRAGFLEGDAGADSLRTGAALMTAIEQSDSPRLANVRRTVMSLRRNEAVAGYDQLRAQEKRLTQIVKKRTGDEKTRTEDELKRVKRRVAESKRILLPMLRATTAPDHLSYLDACYVLATDEAAAPLLGSGGNDGSRDFGVNFAERLKELFDFESGTPRAEAAVHLEGALFASGERLDAAGSMGQFSPGQGGVNATTGYEGYSPLNGWDVVLAMEGTVVFAGALTRRWGAAGRAQAAFPFTFDPTGAGTGGLSSADPNRPRGEIWTPLWDKPATFTEVAAIFAEGRLTLGGRAARTGLDAARSVASIGQARGISSFDRYSLIQPDSKMPYQATPLGRFNAPSRPRQDLITDLEAGGWLERAQRMASGKAGPAHARSAMRRLQDALFQMTNAQQASVGTRNALVALGGLTTWLAGNPEARAALRRPPFLSSTWIGQADDGSPEFRVAAALAGLGLTSRANGTVPAAGASGATDKAPRSAIGIAPPMAGHFAPVDEAGFFRGRYRSWTRATSTPNLVWGSRDLVANLIAVLERRLVEATIRRLDDKPLASATHVRLADIAAFLAGSFDDSRCAALLAGLIWAQPTYLSTHATMLPAPVPFAYAAMKPLFTPEQTLRRMGALASKVRLPVPPGLVARLRAGGGDHDGRATDAAVRSTLARVRASGLPSPFDPARAGGRPGGGTGSRFGAGIPANRLAAGLLIPITDRTLTTLLHRAYPDAIPETNNVSTEDTTDAA